MLGHGVVDGPRIARFRYKLIVRLCCCSCILAVRAPASVAELERVLTTRGERVAAHVVVFKPRGAPANWVRTGVCDRAAAIPGVTLWIDEGGKLTQLFGAETSGQVLLYDASGTLRFQGGITPSRGHEGDNLGRAAVSSLIAGATKVDSCSPVFGCQIQGELPERSKDKFQ